MVQRLLAVLLVLIGLIGLALGRLGETTWAPATEVTATVELSDPGPAVVIDPGVLYVGGTEGEVTITGASDVSLITAANDDFSAYLDGVHHTRITGASDWSTLSTEDVHPDGETELASPTSSDLWRGVETAPSPHTLDIAEFAAGEHGENEQVYRAIMVVTDGTAPGAESISVTWPVDEENEWVPYAYAAGAAVAVIGLVLFVVSIGSGRRREHEQVVESADEDEVPAGGPAGTAAAGAGAAEVTDTQDATDGAGEPETQDAADEAGEPDLPEPTDEAAEPDSPEPTDEDGEPTTEDLSGDPEQPTTEGPEDSADAAGTTVPEGVTVVPGTTGATGRGTPSEEPPTEPLDPVDDEDQNPEENR